MYKKAAEAIRNAKRVIAFTGAGISVESGVPSFRGEDGIWNNYDPKTLGLSYFKENPKESWEVIREIFYKYFGKAKPNAAHIALAKMEKAGLLRAIITQNIDNLHQEAGSKTVYEFHGNSQKLICLDCGKKNKVSEYTFKKIPPRCKKCRGLMKPDFVFFEERISIDVLYDSFEEAENADVVIVIGTTGEVMPAGFVPRIARRSGAVIIEINPEESAFTLSLTDIFIQEKAGKAMTELLKELGIEGK